MNTWLGLVSRQYRTGGKIDRGRMSKRGNRYIWLFIQAANTILMRPHTWEEFSFGASNHVCPEAALKTLAAFTAQQTWFATLGYAWAGHRRMSAPN